MENTVFLFTLKIISFKTLFATAFILIFFKLCKQCKKKKQKRTARAELKTENMLSCQVSEYSFSSEFR